MKCFNVDCDSFNVLTGKNCSHAHWGPEEGFYRCPKVIKGNKYLKTKVVEKLEKLLTSSILTS